jgi:hypothetical protein
LCYGVLEPLLAPGAPLALSRSIPRGPREAWWVGAACADSIIITGVIPAKAGTQLSPCASSEMAHGHPSPAWGGQRSLGEALAKLGGGSGNRRGGGESPHPGLLVSLALAKRAALSTRGRDDENSVHMSFANCPAPPMASAPSPQIYPGRLHSHYPLPAVAQYPRATDEVAATETGEWQSCRSRCGALTAHQRLLAFGIGKPGRGECGVSRPHTPFFPEALRALRPRPHGRGRVSPGGHAAVRSLRSPRKR